MLTPLENVPDAPEIVLFVLMMGFVENASKAFSLIAEFVNHALYYAFNVIRQVLVWIVQ